jgi:hypothetical protein
MTTHAETIFTEDGFPDGELALHIGLDNERTVVVIRTEGDYTLPPTYWTPERARAIAAALLDAARQVDGQPVEGLFGGQP